MKLLLGLFLLICPLYAQTQQEFAPSTKQDASELDSRDRNVYADDEAAPGSLVKKMGTNILLDQKDIWTSPFRLRKHDLKWVVLFAAGTAALVATDYPISKELPKSGTSVNIGTDISRAGQVYSVYPFAGSLYLIGAARGDQRLEETGALGVQALVGADIVFNVLKLAAGRNRPLQGDAGGHFEEGGASFPSGHSAQAWAIASVVAHEYGDRKWVPFLAYGYAAAVSASRVVGQEHFPSDVFVGSLVGYLIGRYVVRTEETHLGHLHSSRSKWLEPHIGPYSDRSGGMGVSVNWTP